MSGKVVVYISNISSNNEIRKHQQRIQDVLSGAKIDFETADVSADKEVLNKMREIVGDPTALAPQICNGNTYCGNYDAFDYAVEEKTLKDFLKLPA